MFSCLSKTAAYGFFSGAYGAALGAANGAVGAAVLNAAGHNNYNALEGAESGAIGAAITSTFFGFCAGCTLGFLTELPASMRKIILQDVAEDNADNGCLSYFTPENLCALIMAAGFNALNGMIGHGILNTGTNETSMGLGETAASMATGTAITFPVALLIANKINSRLRSYLLADLTEDIENGTSNTARV